MRGGGAPSLLHSPYLKISCRVFKRGISPSFPFFPLSNIFKYGQLNRPCLRGLPARSRFGEGRGTKGESILYQPNANDTEGKNYFKKKNVIR